MALSTLEKKTVGCKSSYDWLVSLAMDLVACVICGAEMALIDAIWLFQCLHSL